jgi:iron complex transport system substrate-binding protein
LIKIIIIIKSIQGGLLFMSQRYSRNQGIFTAISLLLVLMLIASACGNNNSSNSAPASVQPSTASQAPSSEAPSSESPSSEAATTRTITDAFGETTIPANPQRIVVLNTAALDNLLAIGIKPVGAPYSVSVNANFFKHLEGQTEGIENTGTVDQPSLEAIAKLMPDIIIGQKDTHEAVYEDLKRIAPVYMTALNVDQWKDSLRGHADAVNKQAEADKLISDFESRIAKFKADMGDSLTTKTVTLIRPREDHIRIYTEKSYPGSIVTEAGLLRPEAQRGVEEHHIKITEEQIADMDADVIISFGRETEAEYFNNKIMKSPLWNTLAAVTKNEVHMVTWETWLSGQGIQASNRILDDIIQIFNK